MYFTHPQLKLTLRNLRKIILSFFKKTDENSLKRKLSLYFPGKNFLFTDMGRTAFRLIIEKFNLKNSQMLMPAYICDIFYPILKRYNITPIFLDIDLETFNIKPEEIKEKLTPKIKAILVCHTYGLPADMGKIQEIIKHQTSNIQHPIIIEDCAHSFGAKYQGKYVGNFGDVAFLSLYKQFPSLRGGMVVFKSQISNLKSQIYLKETHFSFRDFLSLLNNFEFFAYLFKKFGSGIAPKMLRKEKLKEISGINRISLNLFLAFLKNFEKDLEKRIKLAKLFQEELKKLNFEVQPSQNNVFCYLSALVPPNLDRDKLVRDLRKYKIFATRIWHTPIILNKEVQQDLKINLNEFKNTVETAQRIVNFPLQNFYTEKDVEKMSSSLKKTLNKNS
ncbi:DegT/DnrJ/EryC1/StrS family aminotransferase [bacterium]|nr:DegT/DnrJ/EryC1/StrS family aminotransferase [bacterium]